MPGQSFAFHYDGMAEYSVSGYNYSVWLFTSLPLAFLPSQSFGAGHFFGRYNYANYPGRWIFHIQYVLFNYAMCYRCSICDQPSPG